jgi:hypothetical protein
MGSRDAESAGACQQRRGCRESEGGEGISIQEAAIPASGTIELRPVSWNQAENARCLPSSSSRSSIVSSALGSLAVPSSQGSFERASSGNAMRCSCAPGGNARSDRAPSAGQSAPARMGAISWVTPRATAQPPLPPISRADALAVASIAPAIVTKVTHHRCGERRTMAMASLWAGIPEQRAIIEVIRPIMQGHKVQGP